MGENKHIEELDAFAKKYIKDLKLEQPSGNFTQNILDVLQQEKSILFKAKPLISKRVWFVVLGSIIALLFIPFKSSEKATPVLDKLDLSMFNKVQVPSLFENISFSASTTTVYAFVFLALMIFIQVYMLKNHFEKKFEN